VELTAGAETSGVGLNRAVFNSETVPVAREYFAERVEVAEGWAGDESVHSGYFSQGSQALGFHLPVMGMERLIR